MFLVRNVFRTHPGKAKELVKKFQAAAPHFKKIGIHSACPERRRRGLLDGGS